MPALPLGSPSLPSPPTPRVPPPSPFYPPFHPLDPGESVVSSKAAVITVSLTLSAEISSFRPSEEQRLRQSLRDVLQCHVPLCYLELRIASASIAVTALLIIPTTETEGDASATTRASLYAARSLVALPAADISTALGLSVDSALPVQVQQSAAVPLVVAPPPPAPLSQSSSLQIYHAADAGAVVGGVLGAVALMALLLMIWYRRGTSRNDPSRRPRPRQVQRRVPMRPIRFALRKPKPPTSTPTNTALMTPSNVRVASMDGTTPGGDKSRERQFSSAI